MSMGLSDYHKMVITVLKSTFAKKKPKEIIDYKNYNGDFFKSDLKVALCKESLCFIRENICANLR